uniref:Uncharacterized protein n=1 Tax=Bracon brevicornis TaxID=1563983 RepID=A0A6V7ICC1_9HYME
MSRISTNTLGKIAVLGFVTIPVAGYGVRWLIQEKIKRSASHVEVTGIVRNHEGVKELLGEPFKIGRIEIGENSSLGQKGNKKWFTLPISGPNASGNLTYWVTITNPASNEFHVSKIEVQVEERDKNSTKRHLLIRDSENTGESTK